MRRLVDKLNWQQIALKTLPRYTGNQCYLHYVNNEVPWRVKRFGKIETAKLKAAVAKHGTRGEVDRNRKGGSQGRNTLSMSSRAHAICQIDKISTSLDEGGG